MTMQDAAQILNPILLVVLWWFVRNWITTVKTERTNDAKRITTLEKDVSFIKGRLFGGLPHDVDYD